MLLAAQCEKDGGWGWSARAETADRYVTARVVWALGLAGQAGYAVPKEVREKALRCLADQWAALADDDYESKAMLLYARCTAGQRDFESANGLYRVRSSLPAEALLYLTLALLEMERPANAVELLELVAKRKLDDAAPAGRQAGTAKLPHDSPTELRSLYALALLSARPQEPKTQELIDWLLAHRTGPRWSPDRAAGPAMLALCRWFGQRRSADGRYRLAVSVNNQPAKVLELDASAPCHTIDVPAALLVPGKQQVRFELTGRGRYAYQVLLTGFVPAEQLKSTSAACRVERFYTPAPLERDGQPVPRGFDFLKGNLVPFRNELHQLPAGRLGEVELRIVRELPPSVPAEQIDYLVVREPLPAGAAVVQSSVRGPFEWFEQEPGAITFYVGNRRKIGSLHYALQGYLPGSYRVSPTIVRNAHRPDQITVAPSRELTVLPLGAESKDPYRLTPQELLALGRRAYQRHQWQEANTLLSELLTQWDLSGEVYHDTVMMLLDVQLELNNAGQTVKYFEIVRDKFPFEKIPFAKLLRIGSAYQAIGEHERSFMGYRAIVESLFTSETGVPGFLAAKGEFLRSVDVMARLLREYPPESYTAAARFGLAQQLAAKAPQEADDPKLKAAGMGRTELLSRAGRLLEAFLVDHPDDPTADQVAFTAASGLLELGRYEQAASACEHYARRYPDSELLDSFWYITGYGRFMAGQPDPARELLRKVAAHRPIDKTTGQPTDSPNKWPAIYILGQIEHSLGRVAEAIQQYRLVEDRFPDARQSIAAFLQKTIRLPELTTIRPGKPVEVLLEYRNLTACEVKVYRIDLVKFALLRRGLGDIAQINLAGIQPLHEATVKLAEGRDYRDRTQSLPLAAKDEGAYLVVCRGDQQFASGLVLITPLELEVQSDAASGEVRVAVKDAGTGQGVFDAQVKVIGGAMRQFVTGATDRRGVFVAQGISNRPTVIAQSGEKRLAFYRSPSTSSDSFESVPPESAAAWNAAQPLPSPSAPLAPKIVAAVEGGKAIGYVVSGPGATIAEQQIERVLDTPTTLKFSETPLEDVATAIGQLHHIPVRLDSKALDDIGVGTDTPVTFAARGTSLRSALQLILKQVGLTFMVSNDSLMITTPEECESRLTTVLYPVTDLVSFRDTKGEPWEDYDSLIDLITSTVQPQSWDSVGGPGSINGFAVGKVNTIVLSQTQEVHREIAALLERLRAVAAQGGGDGQVPTRDRPPAPPPGAFGGMGMGGMMGGMGGGFGGGFGGVPPGNIPGAQNQPGAGQPATPQSPAGLLQGLDATKGRLQRGQVDKLQKMYDAGMGGGMGGMGAGGMF